MSSVEARLARIDRRAGVSMIRFVKANGKEMYLSAPIVVDAFLRWLGGDPMELDPKVSRFLSESVVEQGMTDVEAGVIQGARDQYAVPVAKAIPHEDDPPWVLPDSQEAS